MHAPSEKAVELAKSELAEMFQPIGDQHADDEGASSPPVDGSAAPNLPTGSDEELMEVKASLVQVGTHQRSMQVKGQANRQHSLVAL